MQKALILVLSAVLLTLSAVAALEWYSPRSEAQKATSVRVEYAVINGSYAPYPADGPSSISSAVNICYLQSQGCQNEEVRAEINISKFLQDERLENAGNVRQLTASRALNTAFSKAISKLGNDGWEMVDAPGIEFDLYYTNPQGIQSVRSGHPAERKHIWFKRFRQ